MAQWGSSGRGHLTSFNNLGAAGCFVSGSQHEKTGEWTLEGKPKYVVLALLDSTNVYDRRPACVINEQPSLVSPESARDFSAQQMPDEPG